MESACAKFAPIWRKTFEGEIRMPIRGPRVGTTAHGPLRSTESTPVYGHLTL